MNNIKKVNYAVNCLIILGTVIFLKYQNPWILVATYWISTLFKDYLINRYLNSAKNHYNIILLIFVFLSSVLSYIALNN
jgi:hypothetical protein